MITDDVPMESGKGDRKPQLLFHILKQLIFRLTRMLATSFPGRQRRESLGTRFVCLMLDLAHYDINSVRSTVCAETVTRSTNVLKFLFRFLKRCVFEKGNRNYLPEFTLR